jgi:hypothetical protein
MSTVLRADARRNLDRILEVAVDAFAELGPDVTMDEIARRAGVGHGTSSATSRPRTAFAQRCRVRLDGYSLAPRSCLPSPRRRCVRRLVWVAAASCRRDRFLFEGIETCAFEDVSAHGRNCTRCSTG